MHSLDYNKNCMNAESGISHHFNAPRDQDNIYYSSNRHAAYAGEKCGIELHFEKAPEEAEAFLSPGSLTSLGYSPV